MKKLIRQILVIPVAWCMAVAAVSVVAGQGSVMSLDEAFSLLARYDFGQPRMCQTVVDEYVRGLTAPADKEKAAARLLPLLGGATSRETRRFVCRELVYVGAAESVPALACLLADDELSDMARFALERMKSEGVDAALRDAMDRSRGKVQVGIINSIGVRRDAKALDALVKILNGTEHAAAIVAAGAMGRIATAQAAQFLEQARTTAKGDVRQAIGEALLLCAEHLSADAGVDRKLPSSIYASLQSPGEPLPVRVAALCGQAGLDGSSAASTLLSLLTSESAELELRLAARRLLQEMSGPKITDAILAEMRGASPALQAMLLDVLAVRGDVSAQAMAVALAGSSDAQVRQSAVRALAGVGGAGSAGVLVVIAAGGGADADAARRSLAKIRGDDVEPVLVGMLAGTDVKGRLEILRALAARHAAQGPATFLAYAMDAEWTIREAAVNGLGACAGEKDLPAVLGLLARAKSENDLAVCERAVVSVCQRIDHADKTTPLVLSAMNGADANVRCTLLRVLGGVGGEKALEAVRAAMKDGEATIRDAAMRTLADWPDASPLQDVLAIAKNAPGKAIRKKAFEGYVRMVNRENRRPEEKVKLLGNILEIASTSDEKRQVLGGLGDAACTNALKMAAGLLSDDAVKEDACAVVVSIAQKLQKQHQLGEEEFGALRKISEIAGNKALADRARSLLRKAGK